MKRIFYLSLLSGLLMFTACQKQIGVEDPLVEPPVVDSSQNFAALPKQIIVYSNGNTGLVHNFQIDSANRAINVYLDRNLTNSNPFERLQYSYQFNPEGYLTKSVKAYGDGTITTIEIHRRADNSIEYISNDIPKEYNLYFNDTVFFQYSNVQSNKKISVRYDTYIQEYLLSTDNRIIELTSSGNIPESYSYSYNGTKLTQYRSERATHYAPYIEDLKITYPDNSGASKEDILLKTILGKDYYIPHIRDLYFLESFRIGLQNWLTSLTDANRPTNIRSESGYAGSADQLLITMDFTYRENEKGQLTEVKKIEINSGFHYDALYEFKY